MTGLTAENFGHLRILATSDVHMHLGCRDERSSQTPRGLDCLSSLISQARQNSPGAVLLLDNGDALQGAPLARAAHEGAWTQAHPLVAAMTELRYDAMGLGNHDFDFGVAYLEAIADLLPFPVLSANTQGLRNIHKSRIISCDICVPKGQARPLRVGLTSALPQQTGLWIEHALEQRIQFRPPLDSLRDAVDALRRDGADIVIVLAHSGFEEIAGGAENFACAAARLPGVDALIAGHTHWAFPSSDYAPDPLVDPATGRVNGLPCVQPGYGGNCLGQIDLDLAHDASGDWSIAAAQASLIYPSSPDVDPAFAACVAPAIAEMKTRNAQIIGQSDVYLHSYFAMLRPNPAFGLIGQAMIEGLGQLDLPEDIAALPRLAAIAPALSGGRSGPTQYLDIPSGPVRHGALDRLCPFEDRLAAKVMSGRDLRRHLERAAAIFVSPDGAPPDQDLLQAEMPGFCFDIILGLSVEFDITRPARFDPAGQEIDPKAARITRMDWQGAPIADDQQFLLAMTSYRAGGGGVYPNLGRPIPQVTPSPMLRDLVRATLARGFEGRSPDWRLRPGLSVPLNYYTSPKARAHLQDLATFAPEILSETPEGFLHLRLHL